VGIQVGRALERCPESARFSLGETLHYVTKVWCVIDRTIKKR
jgi:hypothetical protein